MASFNFDIPEELHAKFKAKAALQGKNMRDILVELIKKYI